MAIWLESWLLGLVKVVWRNINRAISHCPFFTAPRFHFASSRVQEMQKTHCILSNASEAIINLSMQSI
jgi:hypothetical protein